MAPTTITILGIILAILIILMVPWYIQQLGRFFCKGAISYFQEQVIQFKIDENKPLEKRSDNG